VVGSARSIASNHHGQIAGWRVRHSKAEQAGRVGRADCARLVRTQCGVRGRLCEELGSVRHGGGAHPEQWQSGVAQVAGRRQGRNAAPETEFRAALKEE